MFFDDSARNIMAAHELGMTTALVRSMLLVMKLEASTSDGSKRMFIGVQCILCCASSSWVPTATCWQ
jgi:hypothetical protein